MKAIARTISRVLPILLLFSIITAGTAWASTLPDTVTYPQGDARAIMEYIRNEDRTTEPDLEAAGAILIDLTTGRVLAEKNADAQLFPASTTKIMTALLALEYGDLSEIVTVGNEANLCAYDSSKCWLDLEEQIRMADLVRGLLIHSGGDAAYTIAAHIGRKIAGDMSLDFNAAIAIFVERMNSRAKELGADSTRFMDPDGYHNPEHSSTPRDMALITQEAMTHDFFREVVSTTRYEMEDWNQYQEDDPTQKVIRIWVNTNDLIKPDNAYYYEPAIGVKTGYTIEAQHCLVAAGKKDDTELLAVALGSSKDGKWYDCVKLLEYGFDNYKLTWAVKEGSTVGQAPLANPAIDGPRTVDILAAEGKAVLSWKDTPPAIDYTVEWNTALFASESGTTDPFGVHLIAPIAADTVVGTAHYTMDGEPLADIPLTVGADVPAYAEPTPSPEITPPSPGQVGQGTGLIQTLREWGLWPIPALVATLVLIWVIYLIFFKPRSTRRHYPSRYHYSSKPRKPRRPRRRY